MGFQIRRHRGIQELRTLAMVKPVMPVAILSRQNRLIPGVLFTVPGANVICFVKFWKNVLRWPGIEPGSTAWKAAMLTTIPPTPHI